MTENNIARLLPQLPDEIAKKFEQSKPSSYLIRSYRERFGHIFTDDPRRVERGFVNLTICSQVCTPFAMAYYWEANRHVESSMIKLRGGMPAMLGVLGIAWAYQYKKAITKEMEAAETLYRNGEAHAAAYELLSPRSIDIDMMGRFMAIPVSYSLYTQIFRPLWEARNDPTSAYKNYISPAIKARNIALALPLGIMFYLGAQPAIISSCIRGVHTGKYMEIKENNENSGLRKAYERYTEKVEVAQEEHKHHKHHAELTDRDDLVNALQAYATEADSQVSGSAMSQKRI